MRALEETIAIRAPTIPKEQNLAQVLGEKVQGGRELNPRDC